jgi:hypothetical protein
VSLFVLSPKIEDRDEVEAIISLLRFIRGFFLVEIM